MKNSIDRYANIEIGCLLQRMEVVQSFSILATNRERNLEWTFPHRV